MLVHREVLLAKVETTYNTDSVPVEATDSVLIENVSMKPANVRMIERPAVRASLAPLKQIYAGRLVELTFDVELKGSGTAGTAPELGALFRGCGLGEAIDPGVSVTYEPVSTDFESLTFYYFQDGIRTIITGAVGNMNAVCKAGETGKFNFTFTGHILVPTDTAMASPTYDSTVPVGILGVSFTVGGYAAKIDSFNFDLSNEVSTPPSISASDGYGEIRLARRDVNGTLDPESELVATKDYLNEWVTGVDAAIASGTIGATAGNIVNISMPAVHFREVADGDRENIRTQDISFGASESAGDDEISIVFT